MLAGAEGGRPSRFEVDELRNTLRALLPFLLTRYGVTSLSLFGSRARGDDRADSDVDILVEFSTAPSLLRFLELEEFLSEALHLRVDLVMRSALKPALGKRILQEAVSV
jgi:hypothetical protein